jgi:hypothetical protein
MVGIVFSLILSWVFFPIGLFKSGLGRWGYDILDEAPRWRRAMNLGAGVIAALLCLSYLSDIQRNGSSGFQRFAEIDFKNMTLTDPLIEYLNFFPWVADGVAKNYEILMYKLGLEGAEIWGMPLTPMLILAVVVGVAAAFILLLEARIGLQRYRHKRHEMSYMVFIRVRKKLMKKHAHEMTPELEEKINKKAHAASARIKDPGPWKKMWAPITGRYLYPSKRFFRDWDERLWDLFMITEGIFTPMITAAYAILFFVPTLLIVGLWLLLVVMVLVALMPFAWLYGNGVRFRLH